MKIRPVQHLIKVILEPISHLFPQVDKVLSSCSTGFEESV